MIAGLVALPTARLPYQANVLIRSFLLERPNGNAIVYNSPGVSEADDDIRSRGGAARLLINHAHEGMYGSPRFAVPVFVHELDRRETRRGMRVDDVFTGRQLIDDDLEVIPTPGHTAGTTSYLWNSGEHRVLFTGDFLWTESGEWKAVVLDPALRDQYVASLELVRELDFDVLVPWGTTDDGPAYAMTGSSDIRRRVGAIIDRVRAGESR